MATAKQHIYCHITKDPHVCGGQACIDETRVRVKNIVFLYKQGHSPEKMLEIYSFLNLAQAHAALSYYYENRAEIEASLAEDEAWAESLSRRASG